MGRDGRSRVDSVTLVSDEPLNNKVVSAVERDDSISTAVVLNDASSQDRQLDHAHGP